MITVDEYIKKYDDGKNNYLRGLVDERGIFPPKIIKAGMIEWGFDSQNWSGAWSKKYVFCKITDSSLKGSLKTLKEIKRSIFESEKYSIHNIPVWFRDSLNLTVIGSDGKKYGRSSLSYQELLKFLELASGEDLKYREDKIKENLKYYLDEIYQPHKEKPVCIYLCGTDDCSYTGLFSTIEKALEAFNEIEENPVFGTIIKLGFKFSN